jgi:hypothetical protein
MELGITDHVWSIGELIAAALEPSDVPPLPREPKTTQRSGRLPFRGLRVIQGGKVTKPRS